MGDYGLQVWASGFAFVAESAEIFEAAAAQCQRL